MKKRLALLLGILLVLTAAFAACSQPAPTTRQSRWGEGTETHTFKITRADFAENGGFNTYPRTFKIKGDDGQVKDTTYTCFKDDLITSTETIWMNGLDELRPVDVSGTFVMTVKYETTSYRVETEQTLYCQYETAKLNELNCSDKFAALDVTDKEENPFTDNDGCTVLRSVTKTDLVFANDDKQLPVSSVTENDGYYIGKTAQTVSKYKYETTYDFANKKVSVKKDGGEAVERSLKGECIDASQMLVYIRSMDKSSNAFQDNPSVSVYDPITDSTTSATFALNRKVNLLMNNDGQEAVIIANAVTVAVGGAPFMAQYNLPDLTGESYGNGYDFLPVTAGKRCKYTALKFRRGWFSYEPQPNEEYVGVINAAKLKNAE